jgi:hypothetical protein
VEWKKKVKKVFKNAIEEKKGRFVAEKEMV